MNFKSNNDVIEVQTFSFKTFEESQTFYAQTPSFRDSKVIGQLTDDHFHGLVRPVGSLFHDTWSR